MIRNTILTITLFFAFIFAPLGVSAEGEIKLYQMTSGMLNLDKGWLTAMRDVGKRIDVPIAMYVIDHPRGLTVFDTGVADDVVEKGCAAYWGKGVCGAFTPTQTRDQVIDKQLERLGYSVDQVKYVISSHMHLDHAGNIEMFPNAKHIVQKVELKTAWWPERYQAAAYVLKDFDETRNFDFMQINGDFDLFGDGSLVILDAKGHTQGHQAVMMRMPQSGTIILASDAIYLPENEAGAPPGITWNVYASMETIDRIKHIRDAEQAKVWFSHDAEQFKSNKRTAYK